jgi:hypothetical protein
MKVLVIGNGWYGANVGNWIMNWPIGQIKGRSTKVMGIAIVYDGSNSRNSFMN